MTEEKPKKLLKSEKLATALKKNLQRRKISTKMKESTNQQGSNV
jgi:hypothetical protein